MRYEFCYKEFHCGGDEYGEYSVIDKDCGFFRPLFGQVWTEDSELGRVYGGYGVGGSF